jgi:hypothetical protein
MGKERREARAWSAEGSRSLEASGRAGSLLLSPNRRRVLKAKHSPRAMRTGSPTRPSTHVTRAPAAPRKGWPATALPARTPPALRPGALSRTNSANDFCVICSAIQCL